MVEALRLTPSATESPFSTLRDISRCGSRDRRRHAGTLRTRRNSSPSLSPVVIAERERNGREESSAGEGAGGRGTEREHAGEDRCV